MQLFTESLSLVLFVVGALLLVAEALAPGAHFFVVGVALITAGIVGLVIPPAGGILGPLILAGLVLGVTAVTLWGYRTLDIYGGEGAAGTSDSSSLRGKFGYVTERVTRREGEVKLDEGGFNPYYRARSEDGEIEEGEQVMVVDPGGGNVVTVTPVAAKDDIERELERGRDGAPGGAEGPSKEELGIVGESTEEADDESSEAETESSDAEAESSDAEEQPSEADAASSETEAEPSETGTESDESDEAVETATADANDDGGGEGAVEDETE